MQKLKNALRTYRAWFPLGARICCAGAVLCAILHISFVRSAAFADWFNASISPLTRGFFAYLTCLFPFSVAEAILITAPVTVIAVCVYFCRVSERSNRDFVRSILTLVGALCVVYSLFVINMAAGYRSVKIEDKLGLERRDVSTAELKETALILRRYAEAELDGIDFRYGSSSVMPYTIREMSAELRRTYNTANDVYTFLPTLYTVPKCIALSEPMTYTHISGVYSYFTGEANLNINFPDYTLPFTAAHEMAHQRGIAREDEANFVSFLICRESEDPYIRYSGYMNVFEYVMNALYTADPEAYGEVYRTCDPRLTGEMEAYSRFFEKYADSVASDVTGAVNDTFLKSQGQEQGTRSYGCVVDLTVALYRDLLPAVTE